MSPVERASSSPVALSVRMSSSSPSGGVFVSSAASTRLSASRSRSQEKRCSIFSSMVAKLWNWSLMAQLLLLSPWPRMWVSQTAANTAKRKKQSRAPVSARLCVLKNVSTFCIPLPPGSFVGGAVRPARRTPVPPAPQSGPGGAEERPRRPAPRLRPPCGG